MKLIVLGILVFVNLAAAADREIYKNCTNSHFCQRCRSVTGISPYEVLADTLGTGTSGLTVDVRNKENGKIFLLQLRALEVRQELREL